MEGHPGHHHHHHPQYISVNVEAGDRFPQWSIQETRDFLMIRAELDQTFMDTKRNKLLWEVVSTKMKEKGHNRSADQCKCKWKNLTTRYKGCGTMEAEGMQQQFPFYSELHAIFTGRMQRVLWIEAEEGSGGSRKKGLLSDDEDDNDNSDGQKCSNKNKKRKAPKGKYTRPGSSNGGSGIINALREVLEEFMKQQLQMEMQWVKAYEEWEEERRMREMEWKQKMEALENERIMMDRIWREREEQRRMREEARAEKRDALVTQLLNKLRRQDYHM